ncbi:MAG TPA: hypothetical protein VHX62_09480 [Solirubrobacteraceae bacterium]|nr:hypothetical protein [Solirubrobacteraceae bacterium]
MTIVLAAAPGARAAGAPVYTEAAHSGSYYGSTSTTSPGGGTLEDMALNTTAGQVVCASAWVRTDYPSTGASGAFDIWLRGGGRSDQGQAVYGGLGNLGNWSQVHACAEATSSHSGLRVQFYPSRGASAVDMDDIDVHESLAVNGGFEDGSSPWRPYPGTHSNFSIYAGSATAPAHGGTHFAATNTSSPGGGIYEDVALDTSPGQTVCGSAWVRTEGSATGAAGQFALWLTGGAHSDGASAGYSALGNGAHWSELQTCVEATVAHTGLRVQFYPGRGSPTVEIDDVDVHESLAVNGGFEDGGSHWAAYPGTHSNFSVYASSSAAPARSGTHFAATNTASPGGGIYQDVALDTSPGQTVCGSAWVRTEGSATGASGAFDLWLQGGARSQAGAARYSGLGNGAHWSELQTCVEATVAHTGLRVQFYPGRGSPTVEIDDVDVLESLAVNGGFEDGSGPWSTYPNTDSTYDAVLAHLVTGPAPPPPPVVTTPVPTPLPRPTARHALKVRLSLAWTWRYAVTRLDRAEIVGGLPGRTRATFGCRGRGCPRHRTISASGARHVKRLLKSMRGRRYRAGDVLRITLTAPGYGAERAELVFRYGRLPKVRLL